MYNGLYKNSANLKTKIMKRIPSYPSATSAVLLGAIIALFLYGVMCF